MYLAAALVGAHLLFWLGITIIEAAESRAGVIPPPGQWNGALPFLYFCDWHTATWGDLIGITLIDWSAGYELSSMTPSLWLVTLAMLVGFAGTTAFHMRCLSPRHRPDFGYPKIGRISMTGRAHTLYLFAQSSLSALMLLLLGTGELRGTTLAVGLAGGAVYVASFLCDCYTGRFSLLPRS